MSLPTLPRIADSKSRWRFSTYQEAAFATKSEAGLTEIPGRDSSKIVTIAKIRAVFTDSGPAEFAAISFASRQFSKPYALVPRLGLCIYGPLRVGGNFWTKETGARECVDSTAVNQVPTTCSSTSKAPTASEPEPI